MSRRRRLRFGDLPLPETDGPRLEIIESEGRGVLLYLAQMGKAGQPNLPPELETHGRKGVDANETIALRGEQREYGIGAQILAALNIRSMRILTNHPRKLVALEAYGLQIITQVPFTYVKTRDQRRSAGE